MVLSIMALWIINPQLAAGQLNDPHTVLLQPAGCSAPCVGMAAVDDLCYGDYDFVWINSDGQIVSTDSILINACEGIYTVIVTPAHGGCVCGTLTITIPSSYLTCWAWNTPVECLTKGTASVDADYGTWPYTYLWSNGKTTATITDLVPGPYTVTVTDANHCTSTCETWVEDYSHPLNVSIVAPVIPCGQPATTATASTTNGVWPYTYLWDTGSTSATITNVTPGTYKVTMTDANGCTGTASKTISAPTQPTATVVAINTTCGENNGQVSLTTNGAWSVKWSGPGGFTANGTGPINTITNLAPGAYNTTITNGSGCTTMQAVFVEDSEKPGNVFICKTLCEPDSVNGIWVTGPLDMTYTAYNDNADSCTYEVHLQVMFATGDTSNVDIFACYGDSVNVEGVPYTSSSNVTTTTNGICAGLILWHIVFSDEPTYIPLSPIKICGGDSTQTYTLSWPVMNDGNCPSIVATRSVEITPYTFATNLLGVDTICGLEERTDTIGFPVLHVNNTACTITADYSVLQTVLPAQDSVYQDIKRCGIADTVEVYLKSITTNLDSCKQTALFIRTTYTKASEAKEYFEVCDSTQQIFWYGQMRSLGISSFLDEDSCVYHLLEVSLRPRITLNKEVKICPNQQFVFNGVPYGIGQWSINLPAATPQECDSTMYLSVQPREQQSSFVHLQICPGDSAWYNNTNYGPGPHFTVRPSQYADQCDTLVTLFVEQLFAPDSTFVLPSCKANLQDSTATKTTSQGCVYQVNYMFPWEPVQNDSIHRITSCNDSIGHLPNQFVIITDSNGCDRGMWTIFSFETEKEEIMEGVCDGTAVDSSYVVIDPITKCVKEVTYHRYLKSKVSLTRCHSTCWGSPWMMPDGNSVIVEDTITYVETLPGANNECDTTLTVTVTPIFSDVITLTLPGVCDSLLSGTQDSILQGNSCPILLHLVTPWLGSPKISLKADSISCPGNNGALHALVAGGSGDYNLVWYKNGQELADLDTAIYGLSGGYYSVTAFDMQTGCEAKADAELFNPDCPGVVLDTLPCRWIFYPNPAKAGAPSYFELEGWRGQIELTFTTADGNSQTTAYHEGTGDNQIIELNTPSQAGIWLLKIKMADKKTTAKIIVQN